jgi:nitroreductase
MADFFELVAQRESCRKYSDRPVEREKLVKLIEAARLTPSACNSQPWKFVVVDDPQIVPEVAKTVQHFGVNEYFANVKSFIVILEEHATLMPKVACFLDSQYWAKGDLGAATYGLTLEAASLGLGTCIIGLFDRPKLIQLLDLPKGQRFFLVVAVGYPETEKEARPKQRKSLEAIARFV